MASAAAIARARLRGIPTLELLLLLIATFLFVLPMVAVIFGAFRTTAPGTPGSFTLNGLAQAVTERSNWTTLASSLGLAVSQATICTVLGVFFAFLVARTNTPARQVVTPMMVLILAMPPLFFALGWAMLGDPQAGGLNKLGTALLHDAWHPINVLSWPGLIAVSGMKSAAFAYLLLIGPFMAVDRSLEEAAQISGAGRLRTALTMELGLLSPNLLAVATLGFLIGLQEFETPLILGLPAGIRVFGTQIYFFAQQVQPPRFGEASALSMLVMAIVLALVAARSRLLGRRSFATVSGRSYRRDRWRIGPWRWAATACICLYGLAALVAPLAQLVAGSLQSFLGLYRNYTLANYQTLLADDSITRSLLTTAVIMVVGGGLATAVAVLIGYVGLHSRSRSGTLLAWLTWLPFTVPGIVLGLGMSWGWLGIQPLRPLFGTIWINLLGLMVVGIPIVSRSTDGALRQLSSELEEAARVAGASVRRAFLRVVVPLILPSALAGWAIAAILMSGNVAVPILLSSLANQPVALLIYDRFQSGDGAQAAALFCLLIALVLAGMAAAVGALALGRWTRSLAAREVGDRMQTTSDIRPQGATRATGTPAASVEVRGLTKGYGDTVAVADLDLDVRPGEFVTLLGPSGCGKTTTLRCIVGLEVPDRGQVRIGGRTVSDASSGTFVPPERRGTGMVFQSFALWPHMRVGSNVAYPMRTRGWPRDRRERRVEELLALVGLPGTARSQVGQLSGGQQQRVAVARALASEPALLVFDEPLSNLDAKMRAAMRVELRRIHDEVGATSLYVTHDQTEAVALSDRVVVMEGGRVRQVGTPREIFSRPKDAYVADFVGFDNILSGTVVSGGAHAAVEVGGGVRLLGTSSNGELRSGSAVDVAFRAGAPRLANGVHEAPNLLRGQVRSATYLGDRVELRMDAGGLAVCVSVSDSEYAALDGPEVGVVIPAESIVLLNGGGSGGTPPMNGGRDGIHAE
ncbi:MAG TPA: ATP-binding cassette domain-containing protein [Candidatus Binatia bacterium]|nr:ATP-binding cassette domain-containing protein [Candidatus Binatia bacterium]